MCPCSLSAPKYRSVLNIRGDLEMHFLAPKPNWWWRFWQWALMGFRWRDFG